METQRTETGKVCTKSLSVWDCIRRKVPNRFQCFRAHVKYGGKPNKRRLPKIKINEIRFMFVARPVFLHRRQNKTMNMLSEIVQNG